MSDSKTMAAILVMVALCGFVWPLRAAEKTSTEPVASQSMWDGGETFVYDSKNSKDPFGPGEFVWTPTRTLLQLKESQLEGILWDDKDPLVVIEGKVLKKGDTYIGARLTDIRQDHAVFSVGDTNVTVPVAQPKEQDTEKDEK